MLTITDLFCGAGGSSSGAVQVPGVSVRMAANHWKLAVDTHHTNHPDADHDCADISQTNPRRYPTTDILWASPECTNHSMAKGRKKADQQPDLLGQVLPEEAAERSRATMFDVLRFAEVHDYAAIIVENVVDVMDWRLWHAWRVGLEALGYDAKVVHLNSMFAHQLGNPAPQSRDRLYVVAWKQGNRAPDLDRWTRPLAHCGTCGTWVRAIQAWKRPDRPRGRYRAQYVYRCPSVGCRNAEVFPPVLPAAAAIDWSVPGGRIGDRERPLADKTMARIRAGLARYGRPPVFTPRSVEPFAASLDGRPETYCSECATYDPRGQQPGPWHKEPCSMWEPASGNHHALLVPVEGRDGINARPAAAPMRTQTARLDTALLVPAGGTRMRDAARTDVPFRTRTGSPNEALLIPPGFVMRNQNSRGGDGAMCTPFDEPVRTLTASCLQAVVTWPWVVVDYNGPARHISEPLPTQTTVDGDALLGVEPAIEDCLFRMLETGEIQAAMAFGDAYVVLGNKREKVRQLGNAVTPPAARDLIAAVAEAITGEAVA